MFDSDTGIPHARAKHCARSPGRAKKEETLHFRRELQNRSWSLKRQHAAPRGNVASTKGARVHSRPKPSLGSNHPERHAGSGMAQCGPGRARNLATTIPERNATSTERSHSWPGRGVSRIAILLKISMPSFDGFPGQARRSFRFTHILQPPHLSRKHDAPVKEDSMPHVDAHGSQALQSTLSNSSPFSNAACQTSPWGSSSSYWSSASTWSKLFGGAHVRR